MRTFNAASFNLDQTALITAIIFFIPEMAGSILAIGFPRSKALAGVIWAQATGAAPRSPPAGSSTQT